MFVKQAVIMKWPTAPPWFKCRQRKYAFQVPTAISTLPQDAQLSLFPNPNNGNFILKGRLPTDLASFELIDMTGRLVYREKLQSNGPDSRAISVRLSPGVYCWQLSGESGVFGRGKVLVGEW